MANTHDAIVIGGGASGLIAACMLSRAGRRVLVLEQRGTTGGASAYEEFHAGFRSPGVWHESGASRRIMDMLELESFGVRPMSPPPVYAAGDAGNMLVHRDPSPARADMERVSKRDGERYVE